MFHPSSEGLAKGRKKSRLFRFRGGPCVPQRSDGGIPGLSLGRLFTGKPPLLLITEAEIGVIQGYSLFYRQGKHRLRNIVHTMYFRNHLRQHLKIPRQPVQQFRLPASFSSGAIRNPFGSVIDSIRRDTLTPLDKASLFSFS